MNMVLLSSDRGNTIWYYPFEMSQKHTCPHHQRELVKLLLDSDSDFLHLLI